MVSTLPTVKEDEQRQRAREHEREHEEARSEGTGTRESTNIVLRPAETLGTNVKLHTYADNCHV